MRFSVQRSGFRWILLGVLSCITIINYIDRQAVSILYPTITRELHLPEQTYTLLVSLFLIAYTAMYSVGGWFVDAIGTRNGLALALVWWSTATMLTGTARDAFWLEVFRVMLALGQPIVFSAGVKACAEFFPSQQRALATGLFSAGSGVGALIAAPALAAVALRLGWRWAMLGPGALGIILTPVWIWAYGHTTKLVTADRELRVKRSWTQLLHQKNSWALIIPRAIGDPVWYFCFFWIPIYLQQARHLSLRELALVGWMPFLFADLGSVMGGALSDVLIRRGRTPIRARLTVILVAAAAAPLGAFIGFVPSLWMAIALMGIVAFVSQCWTITTSALAADVFLPSEIGSIAGMMGTAGGIGAAAFSQSVGTAIHRMGFAPAFVFAALLMPIAASLLVLLLRPGRKIVPVQTLSV